eukprot:2805385-Pyramimonas_sp.AAC.1
MMSTTGSESVDVGRRSPRSGGSEGYRRGSATPSSLEQTDTDSGHPRRWTAQDSLDLVQQLNSDSLEFRSSVKCKKDFESVERVDGFDVNVVKVGCWLSHVRQPSSEKCRTTKSCQTKLTFNHFSLVTRFSLLQGLELWKNVLTEEEQAKLLLYISHLQERGQQRELRGRTYTAPRKWMRGKGRETIQFGCCYNYATDRQVCRHDSFSLSELNVRLALGR